MASLVVDPLRSLSLGSWNWSSCPNRTLQTPVSWAPERCQLGRCNREAGARKMHTNLADRVIAAPDGDLMDARRDQFTDDRIASGIVWSDGDYLARLPADRV